MFTGIIGSVGTIRKINRHGVDLSIALESSEPFVDPSIGESVAIDGVCLTLTAVEGSALHFDISRETLDRSTLKSISVGARVNLERAARLGDRLGGHLVSGHIDATTPIRAISPVGRSVEMRVAIPNGAGRYIIEKGSVALDGISLTVARIERSSFTVALIRQTLESTTIGGKRVAQALNIEYDMIGKYVEKMVRSPYQPKSMNVSGAARGAIAISS